MGLFRPTATRKLTSPEQLDTLACVISPLGWLAMLAVAAHFSDRGPLGVLRADPDEGRRHRYDHTEHRCLPGHTGCVRTAGQARGRRRGQPCTRVRSWRRWRSPSLLEQISQTKLELEQLQSKRKEVDRFNQEGLRQRAESRALRRKALELSRADNQERLKWAEQNLKAQEELFRQGIVAASVVFDARLKLQSVQHAFDTLADAVATTRCGSGRRGAPAPD